MSEGPVDFGKIRRRRSNERLRVGSDIFPWLERPPDMQRLTEKEAYEIALKLVERYGNEENLVRNTRDRANKKTSTEALKMVLETHAAGQTIVPRVLLACAEEYVRRFPKLNASNV